MEEGIDDGFFSAVEDESSHQSQKMQTPKQIILTMSKLIAPLVLTLILGTIWIRACLHWVTRSPDPVLIPVPLALIDEPSPPPPPKLTLLMSCYISSSRPQRWEIFLYTLHSYARLGVTWEQVLLFFELDPAFQDRKPALEAVIAQVFPAAVTTLQYTRFASQASWQPLLWDLYGATKRDRLVLFLQNEDHVFVDVDTTVLHQGLQLMEADPVPYKSLYYSHWPEIVRLSGKQHNQEYLNGTAYVRFHSTVLDAIQIFNLRYLWKLINETDWGGREMTRIDGIYLHTTVWPNARPGDGIYMTSENLQTLYVPLRELGRHFDAYAHVGMPYDHCSPLSLDHPPVYFTSNQSTTALVRKMTAPHSSQWTTNNDFAIPQQWISKMLELYSSQ